MKRILLIFTVCLFSLSYAQEDLFLYDYRHVPQEEMSDFIQNEAIFWSKVHANLQKKGQITGWAMMRKVGGLQSEPNIYFYIGIGSYNNLDNSSKNYGQAEKEVMDSFDEDMQKLIKKRLKQEKFRVGSVMMNRVSAVAAENVNDWNYLVHNYAKASDVGEFVDVQTKYFKPFFEEHIKAGNTKQLYWNVAAVVNPRGYGYKWNCYTADGYKNQSDIYNAWNTEIEWPEEGMAEANKSMNDKGFYKSVVWHRLLSIDNEGKLHTAWD